MATSILDSLPNPNITQDIVINDSDLTPPPPVTDDSSSEGWLEQLIADSQNDQVSDDLIQSPEGLPDFAPNDNDEFTQLTTSSGVTAAAAADDADSSEMSEIKKLLSDIQGKNQQAEAEAKFQQQFDEKISALTDKFGEADPRMLEEFGDLFTSFRAAVGKELSEQSVKENLQMQQQLSELKSQLESLTNSSNATPEPEVQDGTIYRNTLAQAIPSYNDVVQSSYFKQLMVTPVDPHNPNYTFNHKLGKMYKAQQTQDIMSFFSDVSAKSATTSKQNSSVVVDAGTQTSTNVTNNSLTPDKLEDIYSKVMSGELKLSASGSARLREAAAKMTQTN